MTTKKIRSLLCTTCNAGLGQFKYEFARITEDNSQR